MALGLGANLVMGEGGSGFTPGSISNLGLWLDAALGITLNGSDVSAWADQSGNGNHATQATGSRQPAYNATGAPNSLPSLDFTTADRHMLSCTTNLLGGLTGFSFFIVLKRPSTVTNTISFSGENAVCTEQVVTDLSYTYAADATYANVASSNTDWLLRSIIFEGSGVTNADRHKVFENAIQKTLSFSGTVATVTVASTFFLIGNYFSDLNVWDYEGQIAEIIVYTRTLTGAEQTQINDYLMDKYSIV